MMSFPGDIIALGMALLLKPEMAKKCFGGAAFSCAGQLVGGGQELTKAGHHRLAVTWRHFLPPEE